MVDEQGCCGRGRLHFRVGHHVNNRLISVMSDASDDGNGEVGHILGQPKGVETAQIARCSTPTNDNHCVELFDVFVDAVERADDAFLHTFALHHRRKQTRVELQLLRIVGQLVAKVAIARRMLARDDRDALCKLGQDKLFLQFENALPFERIDNLLPFASHVAHREFGIDVGHNPRKTIGFVEVGIDLEQHFHARFEPLACHLFKLLAQQGPFVIPAFCRRLGHGCVAKQLFLYQLHVAMAAHFVHLRKLGFHPIFFRKRGRNHLSDEVVEFKKGDGLHGFALL